MKCVAVISFLVATLASGNVLRGGVLEPVGPGQVEATMADACSECATHQPYLKECTCFASDVMGTFENDATKELTTRKGYGFETQQTGKDRLPEGWLWYCRPITATKGVYQQC